MLCVKLVDRNRTGCGEQLPSDSVPLSSIIHGSLMTKDTPSFPFTVTMGSRYVSGSVFALDRGD